MGKALMHDEPDPYELLVDRYMPGASDEERVEAIANVRRLVLVLIEIDKRLSRERRDSPESDSCARVEASPSSV